jgi:hypothetical protein
VKEYGRTWGKGLHTAKLNPINQLITNNTVDLLDWLLDRVWDDLSVDEGGAECSCSVVGDWCAQEERGSGEE